MAAGVVPASPYEPQIVAERYGKPTVVYPRLGQGSFRVVVTDIYSRRCAVTREGRFDRGYVTVTPESRFLVSKRIREEFLNGRLYYDLDGRLVQLPVRPELRPSSEYLDWHASQVFRG